MPEKLSFKRKIMLVGNPSVGKSSLVRKFVLDSFSDKYMTTVGYKVMKKIIKYVDSNNNEIELHLIIWDLMGQMQCKLIPPVAYQSANGAIIVCDLTRKDTVINLPELTNSLFYIIPNIPVVFAANKIDLVDPDQCCKSEVAKIAAEFNTKFITTSAKTGKNVEKAFWLLGKFILIKHGYLT